MSTVRQGLIVAIALSTVAFTTTAMAGQGGNKGATPTAPGQLAMAPPARVRLAVAERHLESCPRDNNTTGSAWAFTNLLYRLDKHSALLATAFLAACP